jgi:hypothetical protein
MRSGHKESDQADGSGADLLSETPFSIHHLLASSAWRSFNDAETTFDVEAARRTVGRRLRRSALALRRLCRFFTESLRPSIMSIARSAPPEFYSKPSLHVEIYDTMTRAHWESTSADISFLRECFRDVGGPILA